MQPISTVRPLNHARTAAEPPKLPALFPNCMQCRPNWPGKGVFFAAQYTCGRLALLRRNTLKPYHDSAAPPAPPLTSRCAQVSLRVSVRLDGVNPESGGLVSRRARGGRRAGRPARQKQQKEPQQEAQGPLREGRRAHPGATESLRRSSQGGRRAQRSGSQDCLEARVGSGKFSLNMCSKSGKLSAEIGIQCGKLNLKMLPVRTDFVHGQIRSPIPLSCCK